MLISQRPVLSQEEIEPNRARFTLKPLEPGFGYTLGNSLRRTLLSSIPGAAVTSVKIEGVLHEFSTVEGVKEDVTEILLNVKQLVLSSELDEPATMSLHAEGTGPVTAAAIEAPAGVEVHNPNLVIATLGENSRLDMTFVVERGRGYVSSVQNKRDDFEIGRIPVDSIYSPVLKVTYKVEATRVDNRTDFDSLVLDVVTKGSMTPADAVASAGHTLVELFSLARELNRDAEGIDIGPSPESERRNELLTMPIEDLDFSIRSRNCLKREGITTLGELIAKSETDLMDIRNFGAKSIEEVKLKLAGMNLLLRDSQPGFNANDVVGQLVGGMPFDGDLNDDDASETEQH